MGPSWPRSPPKCIEFRRPSLQSLLLSPSSQGSPSLDHQQGDRYAVLIGINDYNDRTLRPLAFAERDVEALLHVLTHPKYCGLEPSNVFLMLPGSDNPRDRPTRANILMTMKWLSENLRPEDSLLFAFCGHGEAEEGRNFLIPLDGRRAIAQDTSIALSRLFEWLDKCPAERQLVMLDACHSGGLLKSARGSRGPDLRWRALGRVD